MSTVALRHNLPVATDLGIWIKRYVESAIFDEWMFVNHRRRLLIFSLKLLATCQSVAESAGMAAAMLDTSLEFADAQLIETGLSGSLLRTRYMVNRSLSISNFAPDTSVLVTHGHIRTSRYSGAETGLADLTDAAY